MVIGKIWNSMTASSRAYKKMNYGAGFETFDKLKGIFTDPDLKTTFKSNNHKSLANCMELVGSIIKDCADNISEEETIPLAKFLANDAVTRKTTQLCTQHHSYGALHSVRANIDEGLQSLIKKTPTKERAKLVKTLATNDFARNIVGKSNPHFYVAPLSEGLIPQEFNSLLATSEIFADVPPNDSIERDVLQTELANKVALRLSLDKHPEIRNDESLRLNPWSTIDDIQIDETEKRHFKERAWEYLEIAFKHCKGAIEPTPGNKHTHG